MNPTIPKPDYPRPDRDRSDRWAPLNGVWDLDTGDRTQPVTVPYAWETAASGVRRTWLEQAIYRRGVCAPPGWAGARVFLCFGAVHHQATVRINGELIGTHTGGYTSFEFDVTAALELGCPAELTVEVWAPADKRAIPHGKQRSLPRDDYDGVSFTPSSGIWQSVWLEARGRTYAEQITVRGDTLTGFDLALRLSGDDPAAAPITVHLDDDAQPALELVTDDCGRAVARLEVTNPHLWSPADPHLYRLTVRTADDAVTITAGLRAVECRGTTICLNGQPLYLRGVLDQGYWPDSGITAPDDDALVRDLQLARDSGYNLVRKHLKAEEPRYLHWADRLGMLVWAEPASTSRYSPEAVANFEAQIPAMVDRDGNHPCIVIWGLYNEEWGLDWDIAGSPERAAAASHAYDLLAALDHTRPIVENSGWAHVKTDLLDWHYYDENPAAWAENVADIATGVRHAFPVRLGPDYVVEKTLTATSDADQLALVPNINSEYGGGFTSLERAWHLRWQTQELRRHDAISGYVYTELTDIEHESAGIYTTHRQPKDGGGLRPSDVNADTVLILDVVPHQAGTDIPTPTAEWALTVRVSHHGPSELDAVLCAGWGTAAHHPGPALKQPEAEVAVTATPFTVSAPRRLQLPPAGATRARLHIWLEDHSRHVIGRTFLDTGPLEHMPQPVNIPLEKLERTAAELTQHAPPSVMATTVTDGWTSHVNTAESSYHK